MRSSRLIDLCRRRIAPAVQDEDGVASGAFRNIQDRHILKRILSGGAWVAFATSFASLLNFFSSVLVGRFLDKASYGEYFVLQNTVGTLGILAGFGIGTTVVKYVAEMKSSNEIRLGKILATCRLALISFASIATLVTVAGSTSIATKVLNNPGLAGPLLLCAPVILFGALDSYYKSILLGLESLREYAASTVAGVLVGLPIIAYGAYTREMDSVALALATSSAIQAMITYGFARARCLTFGVRHARKSGLDELDVLKSFTLPAAISGILVAPAHWATQTLLARADSGYEQIALLGIAMQWFGIIMFIPTNVSRVVLPMLASLKGVEHSGGRRSALYFSVLINAAISGALLLAVYLFAGPLLSLYGPAYADAKPVVLLVSCAALLLAVQTPVGNLLAANGDMWLGARMNLIWAVAYIGASWMALSYGARGVGFALLFGYTVHTAMTLQYARTYLGAAGKAAGA